MAETIWNEDTISCYGCGLTLPCKTMKKVKDSSCAPQYYCKSCAKLLKSKQYCGICKKIWHHSDAGDWVRFYFSIWCLLDLIYAYFTDEGNYKKHSIIFSTIL
ncbi:histone-lysine N-methyltransferase ATX3-like [Trifolium pratense]|uniref:histone-lysine N-methyltransferase ATX3-like n=1 Tax=Trifolium pratense TaxID=57577 RepID=UPI001E69612A|nr:histone-lysine N-methyltransferase ATX3-like [Trifolium pratense]